MDRMAKWAQAFGRLINRQDLSRTEISDLFLQALKGEVEEELLGLLFTALSFKRPTDEELNGIGDALNLGCTFEKKPWFIEKVVSIAGTGGDTIKTVNVSCAASLVAAGAGAVVGKFGARGVSSPAGAVDVMEALGVNIHNSQERVEECLEELGIAFASATICYPWVSWLEKTIRGNTGPVMAQCIVPTLRPSLMAAMINPFGPVPYLRGVVNPDTEKMANSMRARGYRRALVVYGRGPKPEQYLDEISNVGETQITELEGESSRTYTVTPQDFGIGPSTPEAIWGGKTVAEQAKLLVDILTGKDNGGRRDIVLMNAGALIYLAKKAKDFREGTEAAAYSVDSGTALAKLQGLVDKSGGDSARLQAFL